MSKRADRKMKCRTCKYWELMRGEKNIHEDDREGYCRRFPPVLDIGYMATQYIIEDEVEFPTGDSFGFWQQPVVLALDWCGEYAKISGE